MTPTDAPGEPCSCSDANAQEMHSLVVALGELRGIDLCDPSAAHTTDEDHDLQAIHDLAIAQGADCPEEDDGEDDDIDGMDDGADMMADSRFRPR